jgi:hypothetical protein
MIIPVNHRSPAVQNDPRLFDPSAFPGPGSRTVVGTSVRVLRRVLASGNTPTVSKPPQRLAAPATDNTGPFTFGSLERLRAIGVESALPCVTLALDAGMATLSTIVRCPRCRSRPTVQSAIELRPGVEYLTLRCASCGLLYDAQVPSEPKKVSTSEEAKPPLA